MEHFFDEKIPWVIIQCEVIALVFTFQEFAGLKIYRTAPRARNTKSHTRSKRITLENEDFREGKTKIHSLCGRRTRTQNLPQIIRCLIDSERLISTQKYFSTNTYRDRITRTRRVGTVPKTYSSGVVIAYLVVCNTYTLRMFRNIIPRVSIIVHTKNVQGSEGFNLILFRED